MEYSLIIPACNEEERLASTLARYAEAMRARFGPGFELVVVANGCTDRTVSVARRAAVACPQIIVLDIPERVGKGGAVLSGFRAARGANIAFADADGSTAAESVIRLFECLADVDVAIGSRHSAGTVIGRAQRWPRRAAGAVFRALVRQQFALPFADTQCGAKAFRREAALALCALVVETGWTFDVELLLAARALKLRIGEFPVQWDDVPRSRLRVLPAAAEVWGALSRLRRRWATSSATGGPGGERPDAAPLRILALNWRCMCHQQAGGSEVNLFEQARRWLADGHRVTIFCASPGRGPIPRDEVTSDGLTIVRRGNRFTVYLHAASYLLRHGRRYDRVLDVMNGVPFFSPLFTDTPSTLLIHHVQGPQWQTESSGIVGDIGWLIESRIAPLLYRHRPVIAVSPTTRDALIGLGFSAARINVIFNGISGNGEESSATTGDRYWPAASGRRIVYIGRLKRYKRLELLIRAAVQLKAARPDLLLDIAGDGDQFASLAALIAELDVAAWVTLHGAVDEATKAALLASATVFATPSLQEGWGLTVLEANAHSCPAVAYNVPGLSIAIRHGGTGLLANDDREFAEALALLLDDPLARARYARNAREWSSHFTWDTCARETLAVLRDGHIVRRERPDLLNPEVLSVSS